jgi:rod shape-determining protein MreD
VLGGTPIGVNALVFLAVYGAVLSQKRFFMGKSFAIVWLGFALIAAGALAVSWTAISILNVALVEPRTAVFQYVLTLGLFPGMDWLFLRWQQAILRQV